MPNRGEVWFVRLDPVQGREEAKTRPCVVISGDIINNKLSLSIVVPLTGTPWYDRMGQLSGLMVEIVPPAAGLTKKSYSLAHQVRSVSHSRFTKHLGKVDEATLDKVIASVKSTFEG